MKTLLPALAALALVACGSADPQAEQAADQLEDAAAQSDPTSAQVLENAADQVRETGDASALSDPNAPAQQALANAAEINPTGEGSNVATTIDTPAPPPKQAVPNYDGQRKNFDENGRPKARPTAIPPNARD